MKHSDLMKLDDVYAAQWMDIPTAAKYAGIGKSSMYRLVKEGLISVYEHPDLITSKGNPKVFIHKDTIDNYWGKNFLPSIKDMKEEPPHAQFRFK